MNRVRLLCAMSSGVGRQTISPPKLKVFTNSNSLSLVAADVRLWLNLRFTIYELRVTTMTSRYA